jgi:hypothetical protein
MEKQDRKVFVAPRLTVYGDVRRLTQAINGMTGDDGAVTGTSKTS